MVRWILTSVFIYAFLKLFVFIYSFDERQTKKRKSKAERPRVRLATLLPARNEELTIAKTIESILAAGMSKHDIYVVCNDCSDNTEAEVARCGITPIVVPVKGKAYAIRYAIDTLKLFKNYTHVCFLDADSLADKQYFRAVKECIENDPLVDIVCGRSKSIPHNWLTAHRAVQYFMVHMLHRVSQSKIGALLVIPGAAGTYSVESLKKIVWRPDTGIEDMDATFQAQKLGMKIVFEPRAFISCEDPKTLKDYNSQLFKRWNRGYWLNMRKHGILWQGWFSTFNWDCRISLLDQNLFFIYLIALKVFKPQSVVSILGPLVVYVAVVLVETIAAAYAEKRWDILKYFPIFPFMRIYDSISFMATMPYIFVNKKEKSVWISPKRYEIQT
jgi:cellulose synthase/poly-beta-1,6-N-acetylglucosamine synthase-like glycosyltransferase